MVPSSNDSNGWIEYKRLVMDKLEHLEKAQIKHSEILASIRTDIVTLKTKASIWGGVTGVLVSGIFTFLLNHLTL
jgi:hypothetical protein